MTNRSNIKVIAQQFSDAISNGKAKTLCIQPEGAFVWEVVIVGWIAQPYDNDLWYYFDVRSRSNDNGKIHKTERNSVMSFLCEKISGEQLDSRVFVIRSLILDEVARFQDTSKNFRVSWM